MGEGSAGLSPASLFSWNFRKASASIARPHFPHPSDTTTFIVTFLRHSGPGRVETESLEAQETESLEAQERACIPQVGSGQGRV